MSRYFVSIATVQYELIADNEELKEADFWIKDFIEDDGEINQRP